MRLKDKVAIITGAGQGIGKAYAERFLAEGAKVAIAEISDERGRAVVDELQASGDVIFVQADVSDESSAQGMAHAVASKWGRIDILVNNAAIYYGLDLADSSLSYLHRVMSVNMFGVWIASGAVVRYMTEQESGSIVNQSSIAAFDYVEDLYSAPNGELPSFHYSWSKWGVVGLTRFMAASLGPRGIRVNCICPGVTNTDATEVNIRALRAAATDAVNPAPRSLPPLRKAALEPEDLCGACLFFASDESAFVTGQLLCVDGGRKML